MRLEHSVFALCYLFGVPSLLSLSVHLEHSVLTLRCAGWLDFPLAYASLKADTVLCSITRINNLCALHRDCLRLGIC